MAMLMLLRYLMGPEETLFIEFGITSTKQKIETHTILPNQNNNNNNNNNYYYYYYYYYYKFEDLSHNTKKGRT